MAGRVEELKEELGICDDEELQELSDFINELILERVERGG